MKKYKIVVVAVSVCLIIAFGLVAFKTNFFKVSEGGTEEADSKKGVKLHTVMIKELTDEQKEEFREMKLYGDYSIRYFKIAKYLGKVDDSFTRMSLQEAKQLVKKNKRKGFEAIADALYKRQPYPDVEGGFENFVVEFWLDDEGTEMIKISMKFESVSYINRNIKVGTGSYVERLYTE